MARQTPERTTERMRCLAGSAAVLLLFAAGVGPATAVAQDTPADSAKKVHVTVSGGEIQRTMPGRWSSAQATAFNPTDKDAFAEVIVIPPGSDGAQYVRQIRVPPRSMRVTQWPFLIPAPDPGGGPAPTECRYIVFRRTDDGETTGGVTRRFGEGLELSFPLMTPKARPGYRAVCIMWLMTGDEPRDLSQQVKDFVAAAEEFSRQDLAVSFVRPNMLNRFPESMEAQEFLIVTSSTLAGYPAAAQAVRSWVIRGGRALLILDACGEETLAQILGDTSRVAVIDSTSETKLRPVPASPGSHPGLITDEVLEFDNPVRMHRVTGSGIVNDWMHDGFPIALHADVGLGRVDVLTVSGDALFETPRTWKTLPKPAQFARAMIDATIATPPASPVVSPQLIEDSAAEQIGFSVPSRWLAGLLAFGFAGVAAAAVFLLQQRDRSMSIIAWIPLLAFIAAVPPAVTAMRSRHAIPPMKVVTNVVHTTPGSNVSAGSGRMCVYLPEPDELPLAMGAGQVIHPAGEPADTAPHRLTWSDSGNAAWEDLRLPAGVQTFDTLAYSAADVPLVCTVSLNEDGLTGVLNAEAAGLPLPQTGILASPGDQNIEIRFDEDNRFSSDGRLLMSGTYSAGVLQGEDQARRTQILNNLFQNNERPSPFPSRPTLLYFGGHADSATSDSDGSPDGKWKTVEESLVLIPVEIRPPVKGTLVRVPPALLDISAVPNNRGAVSSVFRNSTRRWQASDLAASAQLRFRLPEEFRPFRAESAELVIRITAGQRNVTLAAGPVDSPQEFETLDSPSGLFEIPIPAESLATSETDNAVFVNISVTDLIRDSDDSAADAFADSVQSWKIDTVSLRLTGRRL